MCLCANATKSQFILLERRMEFVEPNKRSVSSVLVVVVVLPPLKGIPIMDRSEGGVDLVCLGWNLTQKELFLWPSMGGLIS